MKELPTAYLAFLHETGENVCIMSEYYNPKRGAEWNYGGGKWRLSRSKIDLYTECPKCFFLDNKLGIKRPPGYPFNLNTAVDTLLKKEFDIHRAAGSQHPLQKKYKIDAVPVAHEKLHIWRENFQGVEAKHKPTGLVVSGAIDDLWQGRDGKYLVVDYKATSKDEKITELNRAWQDGYKRQMEVYQWLLRQNGLDVSDTGYFVYCNGITDAEAFDAKLEFEVTLIAHVGDDAWVEPTLKKIKKVLDSDRVPTPTKDCDYCRYREAVTNIDS